jgi:hypothetical protein
MLKPCKMTACGECKWGTRVDKGTAGSAIYCRLGIEHQRKTQCIMFRTALPWEEDMDPAWVRKTCIFDKKTHVI